MISGTFKPGVQSLKPGDRVRETSSVTGFIADYIVLSANIINRPQGERSQCDTVYKLYTTYTNQISKRWGSNQKPGCILHISESGDLFEGKSVQWTRIYQI